MVKKGRLLGKVAENGAFWGEKMLKMGQNAPKKGHFLGKNAEMTRKGFKGGIYWVKMTENGAFHGEIVLETGKNGQRGAFIGKYG